MLLKYWMNLALKDPEGREDQPGADLDIQI